MTVRAGTALPGSAAASQTALGRGSHGRTLSQPFRLAWHCPRRRLRVFREWTWSDSPPLWGRWAWCEPSCDGRVGISPGRHILDHCLLAYWLPLGVVSSPVSHLCRFGRFGASPCSCAGGAWRRRSLWLSLFTLPSHARAPRRLFPSSGPVFTLGLGFLFFLKSEKLKMSPSFFVSVPSLAFLSSCILGSQLHPALSLGLAAGVSFARHQNFSCLLIFSLKLNPE